VSARVLGALLAVSVVLNALGSGYSLSLAEVIRPWRFVVLALAAAVALPVVARAPRRFGRALTPFHVGLAALAVLALSSVGWSINEHKSLGRATALVILLAVTVAVAVVVRSQGDAIRVIEGIGAGIAVVVAASFVLLVVDRHATVQPGFEDRDGGALARFRGLTENPDTIGSYGVIGVPLMLGLALAATGRRRVVWGVAASAVAAATIASGSRAATAIAFLQTLALLAPSLRRRARIVGAVACLAGLAVVLVAVLLPHVFARAVRPGSFAGLGGRTQAWQGALHLIGQRPFHGYGFGAEEFAFSAYRDAHPVEYTHIVLQGGFVHESYLGLAVQLGIFGAALGAALLLIPLVALCRRTRLERIWRLSLGAGLTGALLNGLFSSSLFSVGNVLTPSVWVIAAIPFALLGDLREQEKTESSCGKALAHQ
jgi:hypothetical protein